VAAAILACLLAIWPSAVCAQAADESEANATVLARRALAAKLSVPGERIKIVSVSPAEWRDSSLGCPERGMMYTQVLTSGYKVKLREGDREHEVHVAGGRAVICGSAAESKLPSAPLISASLKAADAVRAAVAARMQVELARVRVVSTRPARSDSRPCPAAPPSPTGAAFIVDVQAERETLRYYTDDAVTVSCDKPR
jgi:hypothetical protein